MIAETNPHTIFCLYVSLCFLSVNVSFIAIKGIANKKKPITEEPIIVGRHASV